MKSFGARLLAIALFGCIAAPVSAQYYYSNGQQLPLQVDSNKISIKFEESLGQDDQTNLVNSIDRIVSVLNEDQVVDNFIVCSLSTGIDYENFLDSVQVLEGVYLVEPFYYTDFNSAFLVGDRFCAAFYSDITQESIDSINAINGVLLLYEIDGMNNVFVLQNTPGTGIRMLDLANSYYELTETRFSHPLFGVKFEQHAYKLYDYYQSYQPHLKKVIGEFNTASVWDFAGLTQSKVVAVLDDGIDQDVPGHSAHEDLPNSRVLPGANFFNNVIGFNPPIPFPTNYHGMACAGIIAATHTTDSLFGLDSNSGIISLAPNAQIMPLKIFQQGAISNIDSVAMAITFAWQNGAHVFSYSWGAGLPCPFGFDAITDAINSAFNFGRNGKGCAIIFSTGNSRPNIVQVQYPACLTSTFAVGAIDLNDILWEYSQYGDSLDIVAPSGDRSLQGDVWSLDQVGKDGVNHPGGTFNCQPGDPEDGDYICNFGGTSAAAPVVAGVAALILSKDSNLTAGEVYDILRFSAVTELESGTITPPDTAYGYGRVDAFRAILSISRGDLNNDGAIGNLLDLNILINWVFHFIPPPNFPSALLGDCNCDGSTNNIVDLNWMVGYIFRLGPPPVNPCFKF